MKLHHIGTAIILVSGIGIGVYWENTEAAMTFLVVAAIGCLFVFGKE